MGTTLNGTTPQNTYPSLIKVGDNGSLSGTAKVLSDGEGNDSILALSTTAVGIGTANPSNTLEIENTTSGATLNVQSNSFAFVSVKRFQNSSTRPRFELYKSRGTIASPSVIQTNDELGSIEFNGFDGTNNQRNAIIYVTAKDVTSGVITPQMAFGLGQTANTNNYRMNIQNNGNVSIGNGLNDLGARLGIKGSGTTSATTALLVQNSAGTELLKVFDNGLSTIGSINCLGNASFRGVIDSGNAVLNFRVTVPGATKSFLINADYTNVNDASALVEIQSTTKGFLPPKMTTTQKNAIATPAAGLMVYDTTLNQMSYYNGSSWVNF
jgi:hypothetical protein